MTEELQEDFWLVRVEGYRSEPAVAKAISSALKIKIDTSLIRELKTFFPHLASDEKKVKQIRGPADLDAGLEVADKMLAIKDRASNIILVHENYQGALERLHSIVRAHVLSKKEVMGLKNDSQRNAVLSLVCPEIEERLSRTSRVLAAAHRVVSNTNQTYNILRVQVEIIREILYNSGLTKSLQDRKLSKEF